MKIDAILQLQEKPAPFTPGETLFWDDPHISAQMLAAHLNPNNDQASRRPEIISQSVDWLMAALALQPGDAVLDLGCGPGLYAVCLAERGLHVTGVDYSRRSIQYAQQYAREHHLAITYRYQDYLKLADQGKFQAALLIYGDLCPLAPEQRRQLLQNIYRALQPGGHFVLDVTTRNHRRKHGNRNGWYAVKKGFWKPGPHLVLEEGFDYPEEAIYLDQSIVIEESGKISVYRNWFQDYDRDSITRELEEAGFAVQSAWSNLWGTPYADDTDWIGLVTRKV